LISIYKSILLQFRYQLKNIMNKTNYLQAAVQAFSFALFGLFILSGSFFVLEPQIGIGQTATGTPFTIRQTILGEISFLTQAANVTMTGSLNGITGGTANGTTTAVVQTNNGNGYEMFITFFNNGSTNAMQGDVTLSDSIRDYPSTGGQPTFLFSTASSAAVFAYRVSASNSSDLDPSFLNNGTVCNSGTTFTADRCWMEPTTTPFQIIDRTSAATNGATTTINFRVHVPSNPSPALVADVYTATATLTAVNQ
jgi:hypothetical protein